MKRIAAVVLLGMLATTAAGAQAPQSYKIGLTFPLSGPLVTLIGDARYGADVAAAEINARGGIKGHPVQLEYEDSLGTPEGGIAAMRKLVQADGVQAILSVFTNVVNAQIPLADQLQVPLFSTIETPGLLAKTQYSFAHSPTLARIGPVLASYWKRHGYRRIYAFLSNNAAGHLLEPMVKDTVAQMGAEYDSSFADMNQTDFRGPIARSTESHPDVYFMSTQGSTTETAIIRELRELNVTAPVFLQGVFFHDTSWRNAIGPYADGLVFAGLNLDSTTAPTFVSAFKARTGGHEPTYVAGLLYDIVKMYGYAIGRGGYSAAAIRDQFVNLRGVPSVFGGTITMGADHYTNPGAIALWRADHGKLVLLK